MGTCKICGALTVTYKCYDGINDNYIDCCESCIRIKQSEINKSIEKKLIKSSIENLIDQELKMANDKFQPFNSYHEGYAVLKEEIEESFDELMELFNYLKYFWISIKDNNIDTQWINAIEYQSIAAIRELLQVAAMCKKMKGLEK